MASPMNINRRRSTASSFDRFISARCRVDGWLTMRFSVPGRLSVVIALILSLGGLGAFAPGVQADYSGGTGDPGGGGDPSMDSDNDFLLDDVEYNGIEIAIFYWVEDGYYDESTGEYYSSGYWEMTTDYVYPDPFNADTDGDLLPDGWEVNNGWNPVDSTDGLADIDLDGLSMGEEYLLGTDWNVADTDGDLVSDGDEVANGTDPQDPSD
ncbi:MAG: hypothetical protein GXP30_12430, partial [Verrucomicrobia bacterium]|nr:hypothetical protein [Verrucomicrobiota bacterium]